jgi:CBS domain-containing protein
MADTQIPFFYGADQLAGVRSSLSEPRFATYLTKAGFDEQYALALYLYNARLAKAFLFPLHVVEVTTRNAMDGMLVSRFGGDWHLEDAFQTGVLAPEGCKAVVKAISRAGGVGADRGAVVAELTFDFWSNLLRKEYGGLWRTLWSVFPNVTPGIGRHEIQVMAKAINRLRNRVAHHEPLLDVNVPEAQSQIYDLLALRCGETVAWVRHHTTLAEVVRGCPRRGGGPSAELGARLAPEFLVVVGGTSLLDVVEGLDRKTRTAVCVDEVGRPVAAFSALDITRFMALDARRNAGLFDAEGRTVAELLGEVDAGQRWVAMPGDAPLTTAIDRLKGQRVDVVVGTDPVTGTPVGTIQRAHRRY